VILFFVVISLLVLGLIPGPRTWQASSVSLSYIPAHIDTFENNGSMINNSAKERGKKFKLTWKTDKHSHLLKSPSGQLHSSNSIPGNHLVFDLANSNDGKNILCHKLFAVLNIFIYIHTESLPFCHPLILNVNFRNNSSLTEQFFKNPSIILLLYLIIYIF
jgi:hypothetical protein